MLTKKTVIHTKIMSRKFSPNFHKKVKTQTDMKFTFQSQDIEPYFVEIKSKVTAVMEMEVSDIEDKLFGQ